MKRIPTGRIVRGGAGRGPDIRGDHVDHMFSRLGSVVPLVWFFRRPLEEEALVSGLERALAQFPLFAGRMRLRDGAVIVACDDSGARFSACDFDFDLPEAITRLKCGNSAPIVDALAPADGRSGRGPILTVRLGRFRDGACAISCCFHHALGDWSTIIGLLRAWSAAVEGEPSTPPLIVSDRPSHFAEVIPDDGEAPPGVRVVTWGELLRLARMTFAGRQRGVQLYFGPQEIKRMREAFGKESEARLSTHDVLCGHMTTLLRDLDGPPGDRLLALVINLRRRLGLDSLLLGNLLTPLMVPCRGQDSATDLAVRICQSLDGSARGRNDYHSSARFVEGLPKSVRKRCLPVYFDPLKKTLMVTNVSRHGAYDVRFQGQSPVYFSLSNESPVPWVSSLTDGFDKTGSVFTAKLPAHVAAALERPDNAARVHPFRRPKDDIPDLARVLELPG